MESWRQPEVISPFRTEMMSKDDHWNKFIITYYLDGDKNKAFNAESHFKWEWESRKWDLYQTIFYPSGKRDITNNPNILGYSISLPRELYFSQFLSWGIPDLDLDMPSYLTRPVPMDPDEIQESENYERILLVSFKMGGIIELAKFPPGLVKQDKQNIMELLEEYNKIIRAGYYRATLMSPKIGGRQAMDLEFKKWESERQALIHKMELINWHLVVDPQYPQYSPYKGSYQGEWNRDKSEWNLAAVQLRFQEFPGK